MGIAGVVAGNASGDTNAIAVGQQILAQQQRSDLANAHAVSSAWQALTELKAQDGRSMIDTALEVGGLRQDIQTLLALTAQ